MKRSKSSSGSQIGSPPYITLEEEETMMPMNDVTANETGMVMSCDQRASRGLRAKRENPGRSPASLVGRERPLGHAMVSDGEPRWNVPISVAKLAMLLITP